MFELVCHRLSPNFRQAHGNLSKESAKNSVTSRHRAREEQRSCEGTHKPYNEKSLRMWLKWLARVVDVDGNLTDGLRNVTVKPGALDLFLKKG